MFTYSAICDVRQETLLYVTALLHAHRRAIGTRTGRRAGTVRIQAKLVLRWFRDDAPIRLLALEAGLPISASYRYLHEAIDVIAEQAPDLHDVLEQAKREAWSHVTLDGTLIETDRVNERNDHGHHLWYSMIEDDNGGRVFGHGNLSFAWDAGDIAGRRFAAVSLMQIKAATQVQVAAAFGTSPLTVWRWAQVLSQAGVSGLTPQRTGPRRPSKLTPEVIATIAGLRDKGLSLRVTRRAGRGLGGQRPQSTVRHRHRHREERYRQRVPTPNPNPDPRGRPEAGTESEPDAEVGPGPGRCPGVRCRCWRIRSIGARSGCWRRSG